MQDHGFDAEGVDRLRGSGNGEAMSEHQEGCICDCHFQAAGAASTETAEHEQLWNLVATIRTTYKDRDGDTVFRLNQGEAQGLICAAITEAMAKLQARLDSACEEISKLHAHEDGLHCLRNYERAEKLQAEVKALTKKLSDEKTGRDFARSDIKVLRERAETAERDLAAAKQQNQGLREVLRMAMNAEYGWSVYAQALLSAPVAPSPDYKAENEGLREAIQRIKVADSVKVRRVSR